MKKGKVKNGRVTAFHSSLFTFFFAVTTRVWPPMSLRVVPTSNSAFPRATAHGFVLRVTNFQQQRSAGLQVRHHILRNASVKRQAIRPAIKGSKRGS